MDLVDVGIIGEAVDKNGKIYQTLPVRQRLERDKYAALESVGENHTISYRETDSYSYIEFEGVDYQLSNDFDRERRPKYELSGVMPIMKELKPVGDEWFQYTYRDDNVTQKALKDYGDDELTRYANEWLVTDWKTIISSDGNEYQMDAKRLARFYEYFEPKGLPHGSVINLPFTSNEIEMFIAYEQKQGSPKSFKSTHAEPRLLLSTLLPIMNYFQPKYLYWWKNVVVDDLVIDRYNALYNLGLYYRTSRMPEPHYYSGNTILYKILTASSVPGSTARGQFGIAYDPARDGTVIADTRSGTMSSSISRQWRDEYESVKEEALAIEWMNVLYGILANAVMLRHLPRERLWLNIEAGLNWNDLVNYIPGTITVNGLPASSSPREVLEELKKMKPGIGPFSDTIMRMSERVDLTSLPTYNDVTQYEFKGEHMIKLKFRPKYDPYVFYTHLLAYVAKASTKKNVLDMISTNGLGPILKGGKILDLEWSEFREIPIPDIVGVINTQLLFHSPYTMQKGLQTIKKESYRGIAKYMSETIGTKNMEKIAEILLLYTEEVKVDDQVLSFLQELSPYIEEEASSFKVTAFTWKEE